MERKERRSRGTPNAHETWHYQNNVDSVRTCRPVNGDKSRRPTYQLVNADDMASVCRRFDTTPGFLPTFTAPWFSVFDVPYHRRNQGKQGRQRSQALSE